MGSTVTQTRKFPLNTPLGKFLRYGVWHDVKTDSPFGTPSQTTTSYRSGRSELDLSASDSDSEEWTPATRAEYSQMLRRDRSKARRPYDTGHEFRTVRTVATPPTMVDWSSPKGDFRYTGAVWPETSVTGLPSGRTFGTLPPFPDENANSWGVKAINMTLPTHPAASLATGLIELLREGIPSLPGLQAFRDRGSPNSLGSEHLNIEFGMKPLAAELAATAYAVSESAKLLRQRQRDSGRIVRRKRLLHEERETSVQSRSVSGQTGTLIKRFQSPSLQTFSEKSTLFATGTQHLHETITTTRRYWFSAGYSYYLQSDNSHLNRLFEFEDRANALLGTRITPEVVWNVAPWSWLSDWVLNVGDNISNAVALSKDGLVIRWAYVMCTTVRTHTVTTRAPLARGGWGTATMTWEETTKSRTAATPFGFGLNPVNFTDRQWAILAALGMTKAPRTLPTPGDQEVVRPHGTTIQSRTAAVAFADPTFTFGSTPVLLPRTASGVNTGAFTSADGLITASVLHTYGKRNRRTIRLTHSKIAADPFTSSLQVPMSMSALLTIDAPKLGYTVAQQKEVVDALTAYLTSSTGARVTQLLGGEN